MRNALITALATPFCNGRIDTESYSRLVDYQVEAGCDALLALGTTAEAQLLTRCEKKLLLTLTKAASKGKPIIAGVEESSTANAVSEAVFAEKLGADALLIAPPSFCKCTNEGYRMHIERIASAVEIPLILYNVPSRAGYALDADVVKSLADKIVCVKDAANDLAFCKEISKQINVLCGNDEKLRDYLCCGAKGVISVVSNVAPSLVRDVLDGKDTDGFVEFSQLSMREVNPVAIKYMLYRQKIFTTCDMRLPLTSASADTRQQIDVFFEKHSAILR